MCAMMTTPRNPHPDCRETPLSQYKPVLVYVDEEEWAEFQRHAGWGKVSSTVRDLVATHNRIKRQHDRELKAATRSAQR